MFGLKCLTPLLNALDEIEGNYRDGHISREELDGIGEMMNKITGDYYWTYCMNSLIATWVDRYKTNIQRAEEAAEYEREQAKSKAEKAAAAEAAAIEAARPKMIPDMRVVGDK
jgi:PP-loop superfamily ATP-utilizing enzyme